MSRYILVQCNWQFIFIPPHRGNWNWRSEYERTLFLYSTVSIKYLLRAALHNPLYIYLLFTLEKTFSIAQYLFSRSAKCSTRLTRMETASWPRKSGTRCSTPRAATPPCKCRTLSPSPWPPSGAGRRCQSSSTEWTGTLMVVFPSASSWARRLRWRRSSRTWTRTGTGVWARRLAIVIHFDKNNNKLYPSPVMTSHICRSLPNCASISHLNRLVDIYLNLSIMMRRTLILTYPRLRKALQNLTQAETTGNYPHHYSHSYSNMC